VIKIIVQEKGEKYVPFDAESEKWMKQNLGTITLSVEEVTLLKLLSQVDNGENFVITIIAGEED